jgi:acetyltransferase-like isoleucine patch superfamily enzyme
MIFEIINKIRFNLNTDRIGPDIPFTHWKLFYNKQMLKLCKNKFKYFADNAQFRPGAYAIGCSKIIIGERVVIRPGVMLFGESVSLETSIVIEDNVMMGSGVHVYINNHKFDQIEVPIIDQGYYPDQAVIIKKGSWIGANVILLPGVVIGENSVIGAGSVVTKSIPEKTLAIGSPARVIRKL